MSDKSEERIPAAELSFPVGERTSSSPFDAIRHTNANGREYWSARELAKVLGYTEYRKFTNTIQKAEIACANSGRVVADHFAHVSDMVSIGSGAKRRIADVHLSRFACYLTADNADPSKPIVAQAQTYFVTRTRVDEVRTEVTTLRAEQEKRLRLRVRVNDGNKKLADAAQDAGVPSHRFGIFQDAGYKGLYGGLGVEDIKEKKEIPVKDDILDRMGYEELASNDFRIAQTEAKLRREAIAGEQAATNTHHEIGRKVRQAIVEIGGTMPEELAPEATIKPLLDAQRQNRKRSTKQSHPQQPALFDTPAESEEKTED